MGEFVFYCWLLNKKTKNLNYDSLFKLFQKKNKILTLIIPVTKTYPEQFKLALEKYKDNVRIWEVAVMGTEVVLKSRATKYTLAYNNSILIPHETTLY